MAKSREHVAVSGEVTRTTARAVLFVQRHPNHRREYWIPRSLIEDGDTIDVDDELTEISVEEWFLTQEGIEV